MQLTMAAVKYIRDRIWGQFDAPEIVKAKWVDQMLGFISQLEASYGQQEMRIDARVSEEGPEFLDIKFVRTDGDMWDVAPEDERPRDN